MLNGMGSRKGWAIPADDLCRFVKGDGVQLGRAGILGERLGERAEAVGHPREVLLDASQGQHQVIRLYQQHQKQAVEVHGAQMVLLPLEVNARSERRAGFGLHDMHLIGTLSLGQGLQTIRPLFADLIQGIRSGAMGSQCLGFLSGRCRAAACRPSRACHGLRDDSGNVRGV
ncbi:50S ribosomal protein L19 [Babesia caballi]|uniref:50S ribosomal protein L19 n=1 Tax=Babesia caballi TaxID=5871 RepID=A0AAV4LMV4_BABCB|nr:50S ribosomal protein L19 [Babesia caballi]